MNEQVNPEGLEARDAVTHKEHGPGVVYVDGDGTLSVATTTPSGKLHATGLDGWTHLTEGLPDWAAFRLTFPEVETRHAMEVNVGERLSSAPTPLVGLVVGTALVNVGQRFLASDMVDADEDGD